ncbi:hypothetical protein DIPPA_28807 [Diplonema papillatum]|nr:hypothetical protein DIPPA_28807 [Diplonema papillatum]
MAWNNADMKAQMENVLERVIADKEWSNSEAGDWTKMAQADVFKLFKRDGYKIVVMCEALSKGAGCVKEQYSLVSADDCVVQAQVTNTNGITLSALAVACKY